MSEYPKLLWLPDGREVTVADAVEEAQKRAEGCVGHNDPATVEAEPESKPDAEPVPVPDPASGADEDESEGPTFGPADDDTHAKRSRKKK